MHKKDIQRGFAQEFHFERASVFPLQPTLRPLKKRRRRKKDHTFEIKQKVSFTFFLLYSIFFPVSETSESRGQVPYELNCGRKPFSNLHKIETDQTYEHAKSYTIGSVLYTNEVLIE